MNLSPSFHNLFASLVEVVAREMEPDQDFTDGFWHIVTHIVEESGGSMDDEDFVTSTKDQFVEILFKNANARREFLLTQVN